MGIFLRLKITISQIKTKILSSKCLCRFLTRVLIFELRNMFIFVFGALFGFTNFEGPFCRFCKLGASSFNSTPIFDQKERYFWGLNTLIFCCAKRYIEFSSIFFCFFFVFLRYETEEPVLGVNKSEITCENVFNGYLFDIKYNHQFSKGEKTQF